MRETSLSWQKILAQGFNSVRDLLAYLELPLSEHQELAEKKFPTRIPLGFAARMQKGNPLDPLLLQVLAIEDELIETAGYDADPLKEQQAIPIKGLVHKYQGRVLLTLTGTCAVNCRFCFRRHFPYQENNPGRRGWKEICHYIEQDPSIQEVILSGGDPLIATNLVLKELIQQLEQIPHVQTLRFHTRIPVVLPERIDAELLSLLAASSLQKVIVLHCNHPQELNETVREVCTQLRQSQCFLLNQSVLLARVNDNAQILAELSQQLFACGVLPYYLHLMDKVQAAAHFDLPFAQVQGIYEALCAQLPGYLVPRLARDEAGKNSKTILGSVDISF